MDDFPYRPVSFPAATTLITWSRLGGHKAHDTCRKSRGRVLTVHAHHWDLGTNAWDRQFSRVPTSSDQARRTCLGHRQGMWHCGDWLEATRPLCISLSSHPVFFFVLLGLLEGVFHSMKTMYTNTGNTNRLLMAPLDGEVIYIA